LLLLFDAIVDEPRITFPLFGTPNEPVSTVEYLDRASRQCPHQRRRHATNWDGALEDAITYLVEAPSPTDDLYHEILTEIGVIERLQ